VKTVASCGLRVAGYELQVASYRQELVAGCGLETKPGRYCQNCYESGSANGMKEMSMTRKRVPRALRRLMPYDVHSVRLRSIRLASHPHLEHLLPCRCPSTPCRRIGLRRPGNKTYKESTIGLCFLCARGASVRRTFQHGFDGFRGDPKPRATEAY